MSLRSSMIEHRTVSGTFVNRTRYDGARTIFGMGRTEKDVKEVLWENTKTLMERKYGPRGLTKLGRESRLGATGVSRIKAKENVTIETVEKVGKPFGLKPWQMLVPNLDSANQQPSVQVSLLENFGGMGSKGELLEHDHVVEQITLTEQWVSGITSRSSFPRLRVLPAIGDSMEPTLKDGDFVLVDTGKVVPDVDGIFVLRTPDRLFIKRISYDAEHGPVVTSDNPSARPLGSLSKIRGVQIVGKVIWAWNGRKL